LINPINRGVRAAAAYEEAKKYSWQTCATDTLRFIADVAAKKSTAPAPD
jgi:hypothetical protein